MNILLEEVNGENIQDVIANSSKVIEDFCKKIVASIGSPALKTRELLNSELCKFLVQQNREVISVPVSIIAKVNTTSAYYEHRKVLKEYGLSALPELLRDVNPIFKFY